MLVLGVIKCLLFGAIAALWNIPVDVLIHHFDGTCLTMDAVLGIYLQLCLACFVGDEFVYFSRAESFFHTCEFFEALQRHCLFVLSQVKAGYLIRK